QHVPSSIYFFFYSLRPPPRPTLFPYTTLFRSRHGACFMNIADDDPSQLQGPAGAGGEAFGLLQQQAGDAAADRAAADQGDAKGLDRKSTRLNSSHRTISYAVFCLKKKKKEN